MKLVYEFEIDDESYFSSDGAFSVPGGCCGSYVCKHCKPVGVVVLPVANMTYFCQLFEKYIQAEGFKVRRLPECMALKVVE